MKTVAILLCALALVAVAGSGLALVAMEHFDLYSQNPEEYRLEQMKSEAEWVAQTAAAVANGERLGNLSRIEGLTEEGLCEVTHVSPLRYYNLQNGAYYYRLSDAQGKVVSENLPQGEAAKLPKYSFSVSESYPVLTLWKDPEEPTTPETVPWEYGAGELAPTDVAYDTELYDSTLDVFANEEWRTYLVRYLPGPTYEATVWLSDALREGENTAAWTLVEWFYSLRNAWLGILIAGILMSIACLVYLGWAAGRDREDKIHPAAFNRLPLDLHLLLFGGGALGLFALAWALGESVLYGADRLRLASMALAGLLAVGSAALCVGFYCALAAQLKQKGGYWWRHSVTGWCLRKLWRLCRKAGRFLGRLISLMPLIWQWLLLGCAMGLALIVATLRAYHNSPLPLMWVCGVCILIVCYGAWAFGSLYRGARRMGQGDLSHQVPTRNLIGPFLDFGNQLNTLADVAVNAARNQLKSERMKTELITNVSHDIKTPLTSIINYVDLLQKPHTPEDGEKYLEVLARQSQRMKKLIEDLMEMSKASSGNLRAEIQTLDVAETVNQALGEFADKLAGVHLTPVFPQPEKPVAMQADGRLAWRVLSNVLSNAVKYALPGTRLYVDILQVEHNVLISLKNISREQLNVSAEELMERFVRGDAARNSEGSGLGLNIARSLMEIQHGRLQLLVDGDLFKVTLIFPAA